MSDPLTIYLRDHLAGAVLAIDLLGSMRDEYAGQELGRFASALLPEVEADRLALQRLVERSGEGSSALKELSAWIAEKVSRLKLARSPSGGLGSFEALEFLELGIVGKLALWKVLAAIAQQDARLYGLDFPRLIERAKEQCSQVETRRLEAAQTAFAPPRT